MEAIRFQCKFCIVSATQVLQPAQLVVRHGRIAEVVEGSPHRPDVDLGETLLMPGLVNPHTHLEFSELQQAFPAGENFPAWISQVVRYRAEQQARHDLTGPLANRQALRDSMQLGLQEAFRSGTVLLGDIVTSPWMPSDYPGAKQFAHRFEASLGQVSADCAARRLSDHISAADWGEHLQPLSYPRVLPFTELIGLSAQRCAEICRWSQAARAGFGSELQIDAGVSPHAPYSVHFPSITAALQQLPKSTRVAMHVAESRDELQWLEQGEGAFRQAFERLGLAVEASPPSIEQCVELLSRYQQALLIHGNYLNPTQIERIAAAASIAVVYCPRTHEHFGHAPYPFEALRAAGVPVVLGTDSRASNPSLSLWDEVACAAGWHPHCSPSEWLASVTLGPARALGVSKDFGSLQVGRWASAVAMPARGDWTIDNLLEALCASSAEELQMRPWVATP